MRRTLKCPILGLLLTLFSSWAAAEKANSQITLQLRWHHQFQFAGYYVAQVLGFYREAGLDVTIQAGGPGISPVDRVMRKEAHFGIDNSGLLKAREDGKPVVALAALMQQSPLRLITRTDTGINNVRDLTNRKVMLLPGYRSLALVAMLDQVRILESIKRLSSSHRIEDLLLKNVDAYNGYASNEPYALERLGIDYHAFNPADYGIQFYSDVLFTTEQLIKKKPEVVAAFREASLKGWRFAFEQPEHAINIINEFYAPSKTRSHLRFEANTLRESAMPNLVELGHMNLPRWRRIQEQLIQIGLMNQEVDLHAFLYLPENNRLNWQTLKPYVLGSVTLLSFALAALAYFLHRNIKLQDQVQATQDAEKRAYHLATHDPLTGTPNRLSLLDRLEQAMERARRHNNWVLLAFIDLDNFKQVNDTLGHTQGDRLLRAVTQCMQNEIRREDTLARLGGDEFVVLAEHRALPDAPYIGERLLSAIHQAVAQLELSIPVSGSIGIVVFEDTEISDSDALQQADRLMYEVKTASKNAVDVRLYSDGKQQPFPAQRHNNKT